MKLYLAVATLMLVLMAQCEAEEPTLEERFANFHTKVKEFGEGLSEKTMTALKEIEKSEFAINTKNWFTEHFGLLKEKLEQTFSK